MEAEPSSPAFSTLSPQLFQVLGIERGICHKQEKHSIIELYTCFPCPAHPGPSSPNSPLADIYTCVTHLESAYEKMQYFLILAPLLPFFSPYHLKLRLLLFSDLSRQVLV